MQVRGILRGEHPVAREPFDDLGEFELTINRGLRDVSFGLGHIRSRTTGTALTVDNSWSAGRLLPGAPSGWQPRLFPCVGRASKRPEMRIAGRQSPGGRALAACSQPVPLLTRY